jgi:hypothetical protein
MGLFPNFIGSQKIRKLSLYLYLSQTLAAIRFVNPAVRFCFMTGDSGDYPEEELLKMGSILRRLAMVRLLVAVEAGRCGAPGPGLLGPLSQKKPAVMSETVQTPCVCQQTNA